MIKEIKEAVNRLQSFGNALGVTDYPSLIVDAIYGEFENTQEKHTEILKNMYELRIRREIEFDKTNDSQIYLLPKFFETTE